MPVCHVILLANILAQVVQSHFFGLQAFEELPVAVAKHRKGDFKLTLVDEAGQPIAGDVTIKQTEHAFLFGTAMTYSLKLRENPAMADAHRAAKEVAKELFNIVTINCQWSDTQPKMDGPHDWTETDWMIDWAKESGFKIRGHCLIYLAPIPAPQWMDEVTSAEQWWRLVDAHFKAIAERYGDDYLEIDVMNEPRYQIPWWSKKFPWLPPLDDPATAKRYFEIARKHFTKTRLMPLDQWTLSGRKGNPERQKAMAIIRNMNAAGADLDAVATQGHFFSDRDTTSFLTGNRQGGPDAFHMKEISRGLDLLTEFGKPVHITEFNPPLRNSKTLGRYPDQPRLSDEEVAAWAANFYTLAFSKPHIKELTCWFVVDGNNYLSTFTRCAHLKQRDMQVGQIAFLLRRGKGLIQQYLDLITKCESDKNMSYHLEELMRLGTCSKGEKKATRRTKS